MEGGREEGILCSRGEKTETTKGPSFCSIITFEVQFYFEIKAILLLTAPSNFYIANYNETGRCPFKYIFLLFISTLVNLHLYSSTYPPNGNFHQLICLHVTLHSQPIIWYMEDAQNLQGKHLPRCLRNNHQISALKGFSLFCILLKCKNLRREHTKILILSLKLEMGWCCRSGESTFYITNAREGCEERAASNFPMAQTGEE